MQLVHVANRWKEDMAEIQGPVFVLHQAPLLNSPPLSSLSTASRCQATYEMGFARMLLRDYSGENQKTNNQRDPGVFYNIKRPVTCIL